LYRPTPQAVQLEASDVRAVPGAQGVHVAMPVSGALVLPAHRTHAVAPRVGMA
jgi:hypothetical protein